MIGWTPDGRPDEERSSTERPGGPVPGRRPLLARRLPSGVSSLVLLLLCALGVWSVIPLLETWGVSSEDLRAEALAVTARYQSRPAGWPAAPGEESSAPLGTPAAPAVTSRSYGFEQQQDDGSPVAYDPCRPVHYVVRTAGAPADGDDLVRTAVAELAQATGLVLVDDGPTTEEPSQHRASYQPARYGDRWAPVLIAWVDPSQDPRLGGDVAGLAGSIAYGLDDGPMIYVTGQVELDADQVTQLGQLPDGRRQQLDVVEHELGHLVGLAHVQDRSQLMYPELLGTSTGFGAGDRTGLALLGRGACVGRV